MIDNTANDEKRKSLSRPNFPQNFFSKARAKTHRRTNRELGGATAAEKCLGRRAVDRLEKRGDEGDHGPATRAGPVLALQLVERLDHAEEVNPRPGPHVIADLWPSSSAE